MVDVVKKSGCRHKPQAGSETGALPALTRGICCRESPVGAQPWHDEVVKTAGLVTLAEIEEAKHRLRGIAVPTPLETSRALSQRCEGAVFVKCENLQRTGSFKIRGAYNRLSLLDDATRLGAPRGCLRAPGAARRLSRRAPALPRW